MRHGKKRALVVQERSSRAVSRTLQVSRLKLGKCDVFFDVLESCRAAAGGRNWKREIGRFLSIKDQLGIAETPIISVIEEIARRHMAVEERHVETRWGVPALAGTNSGGLAAHKTRPI